MDFLEAIVDIPSSGQLERMPTLQQRYLSMFDLPVLSLSFQQSMQLSPVLQSMLSVVPSRDLSMTPPMPPRHIASDADKIKKKSSPRNTKAWSLEDERALLQGRLQRVPYKQIGARIGKTDLACRLHFHQMVMAKRTPETAPGRSIVFLSSEHPPEVHRLAPLQASHATSSAFPMINNQDRPSTSSHLQPSPNFQREPMHRRSHSTPHIGHEGVTGWQPVVSPYPNARSAESSPSMVDLTRLNSIYQQHASDFWSTIAEKYSGGTPLNPSELEQAFLHGRLAEESPSELPRMKLSASVTPNIIVESPETSPAMKHARSSSHVRSSSTTSSIAGKCSVESLLNHGTT